MNKLSTGQDSTLGNWLSLCNAVFGKHSQATKFIEAKIIESKNGENEMVIVEEGQLLNLLGQMHTKDV